MVERDDEIKVLGEIKINLQSGTQKVIEKISQEKVSQQEALKKFKWTVVYDHEIKVLGEVHVELESGSAASEEVSTAELSLLLLETLLKYMDQDSAHMVAASEFSMLKPGEFELWRMRIEQYIQMIDYALWEVIENGAILPKTAVVEGIPNEHQLKFNSIKDAKLLLEAVEKRFEMLDQTFDRLQKLVSQLKLLDEKLSQEDVNQKLLRSVLTTAYSTNIDNLSDAVICSLFASQSNSPQLAHEDLQQIHPDDTEEMDLRWKIAMLTMRARRFLKNIRRNLTVNGNETIGFDKSKVKCYNCHKRGHFARECRDLRNQDNKNKESSKRSVLVETSTSTALVSCDVPPPYTGNFMPPTPDLSFTGLDEFMSCSWNVKLYSEEENVSQTKTEKKTVKPSFVKKDFVKSKQLGQTARKTVKEVEKYRQNTHNPKGNQRN
ncbi:uncharacterized mitochondrial protein-like protein [Tanacetum coccineum]